MKATTQDHAWAIVLAAANEAERAAELNHPIAFAATFPPESDAAELRVAARDSREAVVCWHPGSGWEVLLPADDPAHAMVDLYLPICSATVW